MPRSLPAFRLVFAILLTALPVAAQGVQEVPNAMATHTVFIIAITAAFLAWAVSFSLQTQRGRSDRKTEREQLLTMRNRILDEITQAEIARDAGKIDGARYKARIKKLRGELSRVIQKIQSTSQAKKQHT